MMIINGEELITNPAKIILEAQDFMNLDPIIKEENFIFDKEKGTVPKNWKFSLFGKIVNLETEFRNQINLETEI